MPKEITIKPTYQKKFLVARTSAAWGLFEEKILRPSAVRIDVQGGYDLYVSVSVDDVDVLEAVSVPPMGAAVSGRAVYKLFKRLKPNPQTVNLYWVKRSGAPVSVPWGFGEREGGPVYGELLLELSDPNAFLRSYKCFHSEAEESGGFSFAYLFSDISGADGELRGVSIELRDLLRRYLEQILSSFRPWAPEKREKLLEAIKEDETIEEFLGEKGLVLRNVQ